METFDDAFQSRIHIALRYGELTAKAKKSVFKLFIERVRVMEGIETMPFTEEDLNSLSRNNLNGRQVCFPLLLLIDVMLTPQTDQKHHPNSASLGCQQP